MAEKSSRKPERYLSGIQPNGDLHLGNYFGAILQHLECQEADNSFYFIANFHALTTINNRETLERLTFEAAATYLALGLDPERSTLFRQSDVPEVTELTWLLLTSIAMGELERAVSYKDKVARGISASAGLFVYPALMAADILAYDSTVVPVGKDQVQHLEMTREMARAFNNRYEQKVFTEPEHKLSIGAVVPGIDGQKMSKSYGNSIPIFTSGKPLEKLVAKIVTDSKPLGTPLDPDGCLVHQLYSLFASKDESDELADRYRQGKTGYGEVKKLLVNTIEERFADARTRFSSYAKDPSFVEDVLREGGLKARGVAREVTDRARAACGVA